MHPATTDRAATAPVDPTFPVHHEVLERLWVLVVAGMGVGVVVAGAGSRLVMYLLRLTSPERVRGMTSDDGFTIGVFTLGGTYNLLVLGAFVGIIGAAAYRAVAPWLLGPLWFRRSTVAAASGAVVGSMLVHADGIDFRVLEPQWLAVGSFVALPAAFGWAMAAAVDRVVASGPPVGRRRYLVPAGLIAGFPFVLPVLAASTGVLSLWVPIRRLIVRHGGPPLPVRLAVRGGWLAIAVLGLVALIEDVRALA